MAKIDLKFLACDDDHTTIKTYVNAGRVDLVIQLDGLDHSSTICLDKSTAIKFAKTLRTEINKIKDDEQ